MQTEPVDLTTSKTSDANDGGIGRDVAINLSIKTGQYPRGVGHCTLGTMSHQQILFNHACSCAFYCENFMSEEEVAKLNGAHVFV